MSQVKDIVTGYPEFLSNYRVICVNSYITRYGDEYLILGLRSLLAKLYTDIICTTDHNYLVLGDEKYSRTLEIAERLSLVEDCHRLIKSCQDRKVAVSRSEVLTS